MARALALALALAPGCLRAPEPVVVDVTVAAPGRETAAAAAEVTVPLEDAVAAIPALRGLRSRTRDGAVELRAAFPPQTDPVAAARAVEHALARAKSRLPADVEIPAVTAPAREEPVGRWALAGDVDAVSLRALARERVRGPLLTVPGVAEVTLCGGAEREVAVAVDLPKLGALGLGVSTVAAAVRGVVPSPDALRAATLTTRSGISIRVGDVAAVQERPRAPDCLAFRGGRPVVLGDVRATRRAQLRAVRAAVARRLTEIAGSLPPGISLERLPAPRDEIWLLAPAGTRPETMATLAATEARAAGRLARWRAARPWRIEVLSESPLRPRELRAAMLPGVEVRLPPGAAGSLALGITGPSLDAIARVARQIAGAAGRDPAIAAGVDDAGRVPRVEVSFDRERLSRLHVAAADAQLTLAAARHGLRAGGVRAGAGLVPVVVRLADAPADPARLGALSLPTADGSLVPLAQVATLRATRVPGVVVRVDRRPQVTVWMRRVAPLSLWALLALRHRVDAVPLPPGVRVVWPTSAGDGAR